jgi:hypothetical protein
MAGWQAEATTEAHELPMPTLLVQRGLAAESGQCFLRLLLLKGQKKAAPLQRRPMKIDVKQDINICSTLACKDLLR